MFGWPGLYLVDFLAFGSGLFLDRNPLGFGLFFGQFAGFHGRFEPLAKDFMASVLLAFARLLRLGGVNALQ